MPTEAWTPRPRRTVAMQPIAGAVLRRAVASCITALCTCLLAPKLAGVQAVPAVRDSSGITIVEHELLPRGRTAFRVAPDWIVDFGGLRDDLREELNARTPFLIGRPMSAGRWVVGDFSSLKLFDRHGRLIREMGRPGRGPGEFRQIRDFCVVAGDTIVAIGLNDRRVVVFDSSGRHVQTSSINGSLGASPCLADGTLLLRGESAPNPSSRLGPQEAANFDRVVSVARIRWDGTVLTQLGLLPAESLDLTFRDIANVVGAGRHVVVGNGRTPAFSILTSEGRAALLVRWQAVPVPIPAARRSQAIREGYPVGPAARPHLPYYSAIISAADGAIWVQDFLGSGAPGSGYMVFGPRGDYRGRVELPDFSTVLVAWAGAEQVLLGWRDADGGPRLTLHKLERQ